MSASLKSSWRKASLQAAQVSHTLNAAAFEAPCLRELGKVSSIIDSSSFGAPTGRKIAESSGAAIQLQFSRHTLTQLHTTQHHYSWIII
jgi:hypothetical protein